MIFSAQKAKNLSMLHIPLHSSCLCACSGMCDRDIFWFQGAKNLTNTSKIKNSESGRQILHGNNGSSDRPLITSSNGLLTNINITKTSAIVILD